MITKIIKLLIIIKYKKIPILMVETALAFINFSFYLTYIFLLQNSLTSAKQNHDSLYS